jgi:hypothetical protein
MRTVMFAGAVVVSWVALGYKLRDLRKDPHNPFLRSFCVTIFMISSVFVLGFPPVTSWLERTTGVLAAWAHGTVVLGCAALQTTLLLWTYPLERAWRKARRQWAVYGLAFSAIWVLDVAGRVNIDVQPYAEEPEALYGRTPYVAEAMLIYAAVLGYTALFASLLFWRYAKVVDRRWLRRGLRIMALDALLNVACGVCVALFIGALRFGVTITAAQRAETVFGSLGMFVGAIGITIPAWGPRVDRIMSYRRLYPLWLALSRAVPEVVLDPPHSARADPWKPWDVNYRLYRRTIEIRDGCLGLRPHTDSGVAARARQLGVRAGLAGMDLEAVVEAATLAAAIRAKMAGEPPAEHPEATGSTFGGSDLVAEVGWLTQVTQALVNSPIVAEFATRPAARLLPVPDPL